MANTRFLPELEAFEWYGREVCIAYDSDITSKPRVQEAEARLSERLAERGANVRLVRLENENDEKAGLDDFLIAQGEEAFETLLEDAALFEPEIAPPVHLQDLFKREYPDTEWAMEQFILKGEVNLLYGDGGTGKSLLSLHIAIHVALGEPLLGIEVEQMPVLALYAEDGPAELQRRAQAICRKLRVKTDEKLPVQLFMQTRNPLLAVISDEGSVEEQSMLKRLRTELKRIGQPCLLILDSMADLFAMNETQRQPVNTALKRVLGALCHEHDCTILVLAHPSKASQLDGTRYSGSTAFNNAVRQRLSLSFLKDKYGNQAADENARILRVEKSNYGGFGELPLWYKHYDISLEGERVTIRQKAREESLLKEIVKLVREKVRIVDSKATGDAWSKDKLAQHLSKRTNSTVTKPEAKDLLVRLCDEGVLAYQHSRRHERPHLLAGYILGENYVAFLND